MMENLSQLFANPLSLAGMVTIGLLAFLTLAAVIDAFTGRVPDFLSMGGLVLVVIYFGEINSWTFAAFRLAAGLGVGLLIWCINEIWVKFFKHDALGMGDAKWSALAAAGFGAEKVLWAWVYGAWIGIMALGVIALVQKMRKQEPPALIHFAPFLLVGLLWALK